MTPEQQAKIIAAGFDIIWVKQWFDCEHNMVAGTYLVNYDGKPQQIAGFACTKCGINKIYVDEVDLALSD